MKEQLRFPGVPVLLNGRNYYIPSLSLRQFRENAETLESPLDSKEGESPAAYVGRIGGLLIPVIGLAVRRNYPEVTDEQLEEWLDGTTLLLAWKAVQAASGMQPVSQGEDRPTVN